MDGKPADFFPVTAQLGVCYFILFFLRKVIDRLYLTSPEKARGHTGVSGCERHLALGRALKMDEIFRPTFVLVPFPAECQKYRIRGARGGWAEPEMAPTDRWLKAICTVIQVTIVKVKGQKKGHHHSTALISSATNPKPERFIHPGLITRMRGLIFITIQEFFYDPYISHVKCYLGPCGGLGKPVRWH